MGHQFFIEDGIETRNKYTENVGLMAHRSMSLLNADQTPASFWITNPDNDFKGNRAVGAHGFGFWFDTFDHPTGPSAVPDGEPPFGLNMHRLEGLKTTLHIRAAWLDSG